MSRGSGLDLPRAVNRKAVSFSFLPSLPRPRGLHVSRRAAPSGRAAPAPASLLLCAPRRLRSVAAFSLRSRSLPVLPSPSATRNKCYFLLKTTLLLHHRAGGGVRPGVKEPPPPHLLPLHFCFYRGLRPAQRREDGPGHWAPPPPHLGPSFSFENRTFATWARPVASPQAWGAPTPGEGGGPGCPRWGSRGWHGNVPLASLAAVNHGRGARGPRAQPAPSCWPSPAPGRG